MPANQTYSTTDISQAAYLRCKGLKLINVIPGDDNRWSFVFENTPGIQDHIFEFINNGAVEGRTFFNTIKDLKAMISNRSTKNERR